MITLSSTLKRILVFEYMYEDSKNLKDIMERLGRSYEILPPRNPREDAIVMRSLAEDGPLKVLFLISEKNEKGGEIAVEERIHSPYNYEKILTSMRAYCKNAGIRCTYKPIAIFIPKKLNYKHEGNP